MFLKQFLFLIYAIIRVQGSSQSSRISRTPRISRLVVAEDYKFKVLSKCVNNSFTLLYKGFKYYDLMATYEDEPTFLISVREFHSSEFEKRIMSLSDSQKRKIKFILNIEFNDAIFIFKGPSVRSGIHPERVAKLYSKFLELTGSPADIIVFPANIPFPIKCGLDNENVTIIEPYSIIKHDTDLEQVNFQNFIVVDLRDQGLDIITKLGKHLDKIGNDLFSFNECLNPNRTQNEKTSLSLNNKLGLIKRVVMERRDNTLFWRVRRETILQDSFELWKGLPCHFQFLERVKFNFLGEFGIDDGGLTNNWFTLVARQAFGLESKYFDTVQAEETFSIPKMNSIPENIDISYYRFLGNFLAKVIINGKNINCKFPNFLLKLLTGKRPNFHDLEQIDPQFFTNIKFGIELANLSQESDYTFSYYKETEAGTMELVELIPGGAGVAVNEEKKHKYLRLLFDMKINLDCPQIKEFMEGFLEFARLFRLPLDKFKPSELSYLITGPTIINVVDWRNNSKYSKNATTLYSDQLEWFWGIVEALSEELRRKLLYWVTGSTTVPVGGFEDLPNGKFKIHFIPLDNSNEYLNFPRAHTCTNTIDMPIFKSKSQMQNNLLAAIEVDMFLSA